MSDHEQSIPLDISKPGCPAAVIHSLAADSIRYHYREVGAEVPPELQPFVAKYPEGIGYDWQRRVSDALASAPDDLVERWINDGLPRGMCRAEVRAMLKARKAQQLNPTQGAPAA